MVTNDNRVVGFIEGHHNEIINCSSFSEHELRFDHIRVKRIIVFSVFMLILYSNGPPCIDQYSRNRVIYRSIGGSRREITLEY